MENIETDYSGYKECGHPEYRKTADGPQPNDCGCVGDNYAEASAAHAAINTTDLVDPFAGMPNADDSENGEFSPVKTAPRTHWLPSPADQYAISEVAAKASRYLAAAYHAGLPEPRYITISAGEIGGEPYSDIGFQFSTASKVYAWAAHFGAEATISDSGTGANLPGPKSHEVQVYSGHKTEASEVPGLAEHTQAAPEPAYAPKCDDKVIGPRGSGTVVSTAQFNNASTVRYDEPRAFVIEQNTSLKLAEATQAACDTITKAAQ